MSLGNALFLTAFGLSVGFIVGDLIMHTVNLLTLVQGVVGLVAVCAIHDEEPQP